MDTVPRCLRGWGGEAVSSGTRSQICLFRRCSPREGGSGTDWLAGSAPRTRVLPQSRPSGPLEQRREPWPLLLWRTLPRSGLEAVVPAATESTVTEMRKG